MGFDFLKNMPHWDDDERFSQLCERIEEVIRESVKREGQEKVSELELMQALDYVGFNLFRDSWDEFKKMEFGREFDRQINNGGEKNYLH